MKPRNELIGFFLLVSIIKYLGYVTSLELFAVSILWGVLLLLDEVEDDE